MAQYTIAQLQAYLDQIRNTPPTGVSTWLDWNEQLKGRSLHIKFDRQLIDLRDNVFPNIGQALINQYAEIIRGTIPEAAENPLIERARRAYEKWRDLLKEIEGRGGGFLPTRIPVGTTYYVDFVDGSNASPHDGLKYPTAGGYYTADSGTNTTQVVDSASPPPRTTSGNWDGAYLWNQTRGAGRKISTSSYSGGTWTFTLASAITGQTSGDQYYIIDAWLTLEQFTTTTTRSAGDNCYVRANKTETPAGNISADEYGTAGGGYISLIGCDSVEADPWHDGSDVKPIINFNNADRKVDIQIPFWRLRNLDFTNSNCVSWLNGGVVLMAAGQLVQKCKFREYRNTSGASLVVRNSPGFTMEDCEFINNSGQHLWLDAQGSVAAYRCKFDGGALYGTDYGFSAYSGNGVFEDCDFGQTSAHDNSDMLYTIPEIRFRRCRFNKVEVGYSWSDDGPMFFEDCSMPSSRGSGNHILTRGYIMEKETSVVRSGGGATSLKITNPSWTNYANIIAGIGNPAMVFNQSVSKQSQMSFVWLKPGKRTISIYVRAITSFATPPTAGELFLEASYLNNPSGTDRKIVVSTQTISGTTWYQLSVEVNPQKEGPVFFDLKYGKYDSGGNGIYVDLTPVVA